MDFKEIEPYLDRMVRAEQKLTEIKCAFENLETEKLSLTTKIGREKVSTFFFALDYILSDQSIEDSSDEKALF